MKKSHAAILAIVFGLLAAYHHYPWVHYAYQVDEGQLLGEKEQADKWWRASEERTKLEESLTAAVLSWLELPEGARLRVLNSVQTLLFRDGNKDQAMRIVKEWGTFHKGLQSLK